MPISYIDGFHSKLQDVNANRGILISKLVLTDKNIPFINGINIAEIINKKRKNGTLLFKKRPVLQKVHLDALRPPNIIKSNDVVLVEITEFGVSFKPELKYFLTSLSEHTNT